VLRGIPSELRGAGCGGERGKLRAVVINFSGKEGGNKSCGGEKGGGGRGDLSIKRQNESLGAKE